MFLCNELICPLNEAREVSTAEEEFESVRLLLMFAVTAAFWVASAASMLDEEFDIELELTLIAARAASVLADEFER
jgi:hypothetical protein